jgi:choline transport protein
MSEEIHEPGKHVPRAMIHATGIAILSNVVFTLAAMFNISSLSAVVASTFPIYEIGRQAIDSDGAVLFLLIWLIFTFYTTIPGVLLTTGRLVWAFSRDNGLPYSSFFNRISPRYKVPVQAHIISAIFCMIYGLIYVGSTVGFNAILSTTIVFAFLSYSAPQAFLLISGRDILPQAHFRLGTVGTFVNVFSVVWTLIFCVVLSFPLSLPTSPQGMSYVSVVLVGFLCIIGLLWFAGGKRQNFNGPDIRIEPLQGVNIAQVHSTKIDHKGLKD